MDAKAITGQDLSLRQHYENCRAGFRNHRNRRRTQDY